MTKKSVKIVCQQKKFMVKIGAVVWRGKNYDFLLKKEKMVVWLKLIENWKRKKERKKSQKQEYIGKRQKRKKKENSVCETVE